MAMTAPKAVSAAAAWTSGC